MKDLVDLLKQMGGAFVRAEVKDFDLSGGQISAVDTDQGRFQCDQAVLAAGGGSEMEAMLVAREVALAAREAMAAERQGWCSS